MLKHFLLCSTLLSTIAMTSVAATENWTVGSNTWEVEQTTEDLCPGVKYHQVNWKTIRSTSYPGSRLHVIEVDLTNPKISIENVKNPSSMYGTRTLINHAKAIHTSTHQAIAGVNANFWNNTSSNNFYGAYGGQGAHGVVISDGVMFNEPNIASVAHVGGPITTTGMFAVDNDGKVYLDFLKEQVLRNFGTDDNPIWATENGAGSGSEFSCFNKSIGHQMQLDMCNRFVPWSCASCFTKEWGDRAFNVGDLTEKFTTNVGTPGTDNVIGAGEYYTEVLLDFDGTDHFNIGGKTPMVIKEIRAYGPGENATIGKLDGHDLAVVGRGGFGNVMNAAWRVGHQVNFNTTVNFVDHGTPNGIKEAVSGNIMAMKNGEIQPYTTSTAAPYGQGGYDNSYYPRTLLGVNADRTKFYMLVCEHNVKNPTRYFGFTTEQMCIMARDHFGVSNATQMDCGGSTYMYAKGGNVARSYDNASGERAVYNGVFVCYNGDDVKLPDPGTYVEEEDPNIQDPDKGWVDSGERAHFAYGLSTAADGRGVPTANYFLTGDVKAVDVILTNANDDTDVVTIAGGTAKGLNTVYVDDPALTQGANYKWAVKVYSNPVTATSHFLHDAPGKLDARGGVGVVMDPESPAYGNVIYSMGYAQGFGMYNADGTKAGNWHNYLNEAERPVPWTITNRSDLYRIAMRDKNTAYACCFSDKGAGYWKFDPTNPTQVPENLSGGVNDGKGCFKVGNTVVGSGAPGIAFQRKSDNEEYFWVFAEDWPSGNNKDFIGILCKWKTNFETKIEHGLMGAIGELAGKTGDGVTDGLFASQNVCITGIPGGVFCAQGRTSGQNTTKVPAFLYIDEGFNILYNSGEHPDLFTSCGGSSAISDDLSLFAISGYNEHIKVYDVTWEGNVPSFKFRALVNNTQHVTEVSQLAFDPAGNLYAWQRSTNGDYAGLFGYSWKNDAPEALTPAKANDLILAQKFTGIDNIVTDADSATPVYYTVQGVRVDNANLAPGLYIKVTGRKAEKVVIK